MSASDVIVASPATATGGITAAPIGTALNTDATTATNPAFVKGGYIGEDGLTMAVARTTEKIRAWGGDTVRVVQTEHDVTFSFTFLETTGVSAKHIYGDANVIATAATGSVGGLLAIKVNSDVLESKAWQFEMKDGLRRGRVVVPNGQITEVGETTFVHSNATGHQVTMEAFPDASGNKAYIYWNDGVPNPAAPAAWVADTWYQLGAVVTLTTGTVEAIDPGTSGSGPAPSLPGSVGGTVTDGTIVWRRLT